MSIHVLQADFSIEHQRRLVVEALPELESFIIIGCRPKNSGKMRNFASCSFSPEDLANAIANFLACAPQAVEPFFDGVMTCLDSQEKWPTDN